MTAKVISIGEHELFRHRDSQSPDWRAGEDGAVKECEHKSLHADDHGEIITCKECGKQIGAYWAFMRFSDQYREHLDHLHHKQEQIRQDEQRLVTLRAAQLVEKAWRRRTVVPTCPHCKTPITAKDGFGNRFARKPGTAQLRANTSGLAAVEKGNPA